MSVSMSGSMAIHVSVHVRLPSGAALAPYFEKLARGVLFSFLFLSTCVIIPPPTSLGSHSSPVAKEVDPAMLTTANFFSRKCVLYS